MIRKRKTIAGFFRKNRLPLVSMGSRFLQCGILFPELGQRHVPLALVAGIATMIGQGQNLLQIMDEGFGEDH